MSSNLSSSNCWYFTFYTWISSYYTLDHQSLQNLNQYLTLLAELHRKKYKFTTGFYDLIQKQIDEMTKSNNKDNNLFFKNYRIIEFKDVQFTELLNFILNEIKDQVEFGEMLRIERCIKERVKEKEEKENEFKNKLNNDDLDYGETIEFDGSLSSLSSTSTSPTSSQSSTRVSSISSTDFSLIKKFYPERIFEYLNDRGDNNDHDDNLYKLILKKQLEIIYEIGDVSENIKILKRLLSNHSNNDPFKKDDASLFLIIIYSTCQLLEKLNKLDIIHFDKNCIELIYDLELFMKSIKCITLSLNRDYFDDVKDNDVKDNDYKMNLFKFSLYSIIIIIFQLYFFRLFLNICLAY